jgi:DNA-binding response OmpR family regulator
MQKILLIDDETDLIFLMKAVLTKAGYEVTTSSNGVEALGKLYDLNPDLIVLDLNMPKLGGIEFYERICHGDKSLYPVLITTARADTEKLFRELNVDGFISKPFNGAQILNAVEVILKKHTKIKKKEKVIAKVLIIENDEKVSSNIAMALLKAGHTVDLASNGILAEERIKKSSPDVVFVQLGLPDTPGNIVISKLKKILPKSKHILYTHGKVEGFVIAEKFGQKQGIDSFVELMEPPALISALEDLL